ncbi:LPS-assembly protein LptD [Parendozoicomonas haliclonae]|uniref:LPS-assembly protein LptD n=1 Tax=Parendozoicomonas haliclonae TaxID=1960125 RepID=A0A1X7AFE2_9GAMM|nr:LPS-assembly protein LptD [Parendozoicomonas haliclonae]SMA35416.1 LPS-assembly protein LptD precursor [Parendozoicomonas haliclonae]
MAKNIFILKNKLPLVITTGLMVSTPVLPAIANQALSNDSQWLCQQDSSGGGWQCNIAPRKQGPIPFAQRAVVKPAVKQKASVPVTITETSSQASAASAATAQTAPAGANVSVLPVSVTAATSGPTTSVSQAFSSLDWRRIDELSLFKQKQRRAMVCEGFYQEPNRPGIDYKGDPADAPIYAESDNSSYNENGKGTLSGNVVVRQGYRQIESNTAHLNRNSSEADFVGDVVIREPNLLLVGDRADVNMDSGYAEISNAKYVFHQEGIRGEATNIVRRESGVIELNKATYTTCPPGECTWKMNGKQVELNPNSGFGTATHATVDLYGLPIFYTPWITFPIDDRRKSGLLFPTFAWGFEGDSNGFDYTQPIYWNIAPNMDATITPRIMTRRGGLLETEFRYLSQHSYTELGGAYTTPDRQEKKNLYYDRNRWLVNMNHRQQLSHNWNVDANFTNVSDREYFNDFGSDLKVESTDPLHQQVYATYQSSGSDLYQWGVKIGTQHLKNMTDDGDDPYNKNIDLTFDGNWGEGVGLGFDYLVNYTDFLRDKEWKYLRQEQVNERNETYKSIWGEGSGINNAVGGRLYTEAGTKYRFENSYSFIEPGVKMRSVHYRLDRLSDSYINGVGSRDKAERPDTTAPTAYLDGGMFFERPTALAGLKMTQTLEPRMRYVYTPYRSGQSLNPDLDSNNSTFSYGSLWRDDRFSGYDRIGDTNQLSLGLTTRFLEENGYERFRFSIGQIVYFEDRKVYIDPTLDEGINEDTNLGEENQRLVDANKASRSPIATQMVWNIRPDLRLTQDWVYNTDKSWNQDYAFGVQYLPQPGAVVNLRYQYRNQVERALKHSNGPDKGNNVIDPITNKPVFVNGDMEEATFSTVWPLSSQWSVMARYTYDMTNKRKMDRAFGFEQDSCCYTMRVMYRNWIDPDEDIDVAEKDKGIFFEFVLKGLGNITTSKVTEFLRDVSGYSSR